ncbi:hypothetical protein ONZ45_g13427 [Pleurotus djamor]|nr:hypothetical protein ONZ45_g13427 [Pleurotus djamor]
MVARANTRLVFNKVPSQGLPVPGETSIYDASQTIDLDDTPLNGGFLVKTLCVCLDVYVYARMVAAGGKWAGLPPIPLGGPVENCVGTVLRSENPNFKTGEHVYNSQAFFRQTAYLGWKAFAKPKRGEVAFVSSGAGTVGSVVAQLAKLDGLKVIASVGSDDKVKLLESLGVDVAFNYKTTKIDDVLAEHGPIDLYWDNVGGETLEAALGAANRYARFIECGMLSSLPTNPYFIKNLFLIVAKAITLTGFGIVDLMKPDAMADFYETVPKLIANGSLKAIEDIREGFEKGGEALVESMAGHNGGKVILKIAD